jgi:hypothetical protein
MYEARSPVTVAWAGETETAAALATLADRLGPPPFSLLIFFAGVHHDLAAIARGLCARYPGVPLVGCTSAGEYADSGHSTGSITAMGMRPPIRAAAELIPLDTFAFDAGAAVLERLAAQIGTTRAGLSRERHAILTLTDGLSGLGELLGASIGAHAVGIPLVGGCAADDLSFQRTQVVVGDRAHPRGGVVVLLEPGVPFAPFAFHHFHPTERRVVVTRAEPRRRLVQELDGWPADEGLARLLGLPVETLRADPVGVLSRTPAILGICQGGEWHVRSVMTLEGEALLMGGAVEEGTVFRWMTPGDLVAETEAALAGLAEQLRGPPAATLMFHCFGRMRTARFHGARDSLARVLARWPVAGFDTFGEHLGPFLVNETLTGLAIGSPR